MTIQNNRLQTDLSVEWKEEFSRAKKYKEAAQKRKEEKMVLEEKTRIEKKATTGRLRVEP